MADDSHPTPFGDSATPQFADNDNWRRIGGVVQGVVEQAKRARAERITAQEFTLAETDWEGDAVGYGACRHCGREVKCSAMWTARGDVEAISSGGLQGCENPKCGDKMPADMIRMAIASAWLAAPRFQRLQEIGFAIDIAVQNGDATAERMARDALIRWRMEGME